MPRLYKVGDRAAASERDGLPGRKAGLPTLTKMRQSRTRPQRRFVTVQNARSRLRLVTFARNYRRTGVCGCL